ncbi:hypothetical protein [Halopiger xanaduensis]|uniref:Uncharacterized protein n=1 Tax=Halopiger xanaduensis (strain DSM 18323 / JCM 14033 / SH-6) TaxID=797210 RepID=F8D3Z2_HALXS|nr:hypothetical protein [Halopiger xanaduensis]AEH36245.1 hypothetical protein Halxa_1613 [Halopiger xanaduensis SH-6]
MDERDDPDRMIAACTHCGALYAATELSDGSILPIGRRDGCRCGGTTFTKVNEELLENATGGGPAATETDDEVESED